MPKKLSEFTTGQRITDSEGNSRIYVSKSGSDKYVEHADLVSRDYHTGIQPLSTISDAGAMAAKEEIALTDIAVQNGETLLANNSVSIGRPVAITPAQARTLLNVANGATANDTDANLRNRANHTGTQPLSSVTGLTDALGTIDAYSVATDALILDLSGTRYTVAAGADNTGPGGSGRTLYIANASGTPSYGEVNITSGNIDIDEGETTTVTVVRSNGVSGAVTVTWTVSPGTHTVTDTGTISWNANEGGPKTFTLTGEAVGGDITGGTVTITVTSGSATVGSTGSVTIATRNVVAETPGVFSIESTTPVGESGTTFTMIFDRSSGSSGDVAVDWTCTSGNHTTVLSGTETWVAGNSARHTVTFTRATVGVNTFGTITLSNPRRTDGGTVQPTLGTPVAGYFASSPPTSAGTISLVSTAIDEDENTPLPIVLTRAGGSAGEAVARWTITGDTGVDTATGTITWAAGEFGDKSPTVLPVGNLVLADKTGGILTVTIVSGSATLQAPVTGTIAVRDVPAGYTIGNAVSGLPFTVTPPTSPTITLSDINITTGNVGSYTGINSSAANGRRLLFGAGAYGDITITGSNQEIVLTTGVTIRTLTTSSAAQYIKITADPIREGSIGYLRMNGQDITIDGITQSHVSLGGGLYDDTHNSFLVSRLAVINSSFYTRNYLVQGFCTVSNPLQDAIFGNNSLIQGPTSLNPSAASPFPAWRTQGAQRVVVVDNLIRSDISHARHNFRVHAQADGSGLNAQYHYIARNQLEGEGNMITRAGDPPGTSPGTVNDIYFVDNEVYVSGSLILMDLSPGNAANRPNGVTITGNAGYKTGASWPTAISGWTIDGTNTAAAYSSPPAWSFA